MLQKAAAVAITVFIVGAVATVAVLVMAPMVELDLPIVDLLAASLGVTLLALVHGLVALAPAPLLDDARLPSASVPGLLLPASYSTASTRSPAGSTAST